MADLGNRFLTSKLSLLESGDIAPRTFADYKGNCDRLIAMFGKKRLVSDLAADDFEALRTDVAKTCGPHGISNVVLRTRVLFKYALDHGLIDKPVRFGPVFKLPSRKTMRKDKAAKGAKMFEAPEVRRIIAGADVQFRAMVLLGINCGFGNTDCARLPLSALDLDGGWLDFARPKTGVERRCPLWPETVQALRAWLAARPEPSDPKAEPLVFVTPGGMAWGRDTSYTPMANRFADLLKRVAAYRKLRGFYSLRHAFRTVADESRDQPAVNAIMGHSDETMAGRYRERISDERLRAVADHVRKWLYPPQAQKKTATTKKPVEARARRAKQVSEATALRVVG
jgi:integrase